MCRTPPRGRRFPRAGDTASRRSAAWVAADVPGWYHHPPPSPSPACSSSRHDDQNLVKTAADAPRRRQTRAPSKAAAPWHLRQRPHQRQPPERHVARPITRNRHLDPHRRAAHRDPPRRTRELQSPRAGPARRALQSLHRHPHATPHRASPRTTVARTAPPLDSESPNLTCGSRAAGSGRERREPARCLFGDRRRRGRPDRAGREAPAPRSPHARIRGEGGLRHVGPGGQRLGRGRGSRPAAGSPPGRACGCPSRAARPGRRGPSRTRRSACRPSSRRRSRRRTGTAR